MCRSKWWQMASSPQKMGASLLGFTSRNQDWLLPRLDLHLVEEGLRVTLNLSIWFYTIQLKHFSNKIVLFRSTLYNFKMYRKTLTPLPNWLTFKTYCFLSVIFTRVRIIFKMGRLISPARKRVKLELRLGNDTVFAFDYLEHTCKKLGKSKHF